MNTVWALPAIMASLLGANASSTAVGVEPPASANSNRPEAVSPDIGDPATAVLDLDDDRNHRYTVPVMVGAAGPFDFMIDTGSQATAVTHQINEGLGLQPIATATLVGMASRRSVDLVEVDTMSFANHTVTEVLSPVLDRQHVGADGILGLDSLQNLRVLLDFRKETIAVQDVSELRNSRAGFEIIVRARRELGQLLITNAMVEGVRATVIIDTGAQSSIGNLALQERIRAKRSQEVTTTDVNGISITGEMQMVRSLDIEGMALTNVALTFADAPAFEVLGLDDEPVLSLGMDHLRVFDRVAIDFANRRVLFDVPRDVARAMKRNRMRGLTPSF